MVRREAPDATGYRHARRLSVKARDQQPRQPEMVAVVKLGSRQGAIQKRLQKLVVGH
jgi:hypothetical protein